MSKKEIKELTVRIIRVVLGVIVVLSVLFLLAYSETHYTRTGFVKRKAVTLNEYYFYDSTGNVWLFESDEDLNSDMVIEAKMFTNCTTDNIKDDILVDYQILSQPELKIKIEK